MTVDIPMIDLFSPVAETKESDLSYDPAKVAEERMALVLPEPDQLFVDIDDDESYQRLLRGLDLLRKNGMLIDVERTTPSRSGMPHRHVYLRVRTQSSLPITSTERVLLQACLGSDRGREALSYLRIKKQTLRPIACFFEEKVQ